MGGSAVGPPQAPRRPREIPAGPAPDAASLREAALNHLARFASTESNLVRVLQRRIARWAQRAEREGQPSEEIARHVAAARERRRKRRVTWSPPARWTMPPLPRPGSGG